MTTNENLLTMYMFFAVLLVALAVIWVISVIKSRKVTKELKSEYMEVSNQLTSIQFYHNSLRQVRKLNFDDLIAIHKGLDKDGVLPPNLDPDRYGMFRTSSIQEMKKSEVYLGNISGLWTKTIEYWESCNDKESIEIVWNQYYHMLWSNVSSALTKLRNRRYELAQKLGYDNYLQ